MDRCLMRLKVFLAAAAGWLCAVVEPAAAAESPWVRHAIDRPAKRGGADGVRLADASGDGLLDIATGWEEGGRVRVYINPGAKKAKELWPAVTVGKVASPEDAVLVDVDGDGAMDVVSSCEGKTRSIFVHWAPADRAKYLDPAAWKTEAIPAARGKQMWMFALPIRDAAGLRFVVGSKGQGGTVSLLTPGAKPRELAAWRLRPLCKAGWIMSLEAVDIDGDGDEDVLGSDRLGKGQGVFWLENPGANDRKAPWQRHAVGGAGRTVMFLAAGDLDHDGHRDILCAARHADILWLRGTGNPRAAWPASDVAMPAGCGLGKAVAVGDIDGDGTGDVVFTCGEATGGKSGVRWLRRDPDAKKNRWVDHEISGPEGVKFDLVKLIDLDGDGDLDVLTCEERDDLGVVWYENPTK